MNDFSVDVYIEFEGSGKLVSLSLPLRQVYYLDRNSVREVKPDGTVVYRLPRRRDIAGALTDSNMDRGWAAA